MNREIIINLLNRIASNWDRNGADQILNQFRFENLIAFPSETTQDLSLVIKEIGWLPSHKVIVKRGQGSRIEDNNIATAMLERVANKDNTTAIVFDMENFLQNEKVASSIIIALHGVQLKHSINLSEKFSICPRCEIKPTKERELVFSINSKSQEIFSIDASRNFLHIPQAAIVVKYPLDQVLFEDFSNISVNSDSIDLAIEIKKILAAITLSGFSSPVIGISYNLIEHPAIPYHGLGGMVFNYGYLPPPHFSGLVDESCLINIYKKICECSDNVWNSVSLGVERLAKSRNTIFPTDKAIDLGIALESMLTHGESGTGAKGELRYKIASRGAWLIEKTSEARESTFRTLQQAYDARSAAVHSGNISTEKMKVLGVADSLCVKIAKRILKLRKFPTWNKLVLGSYEY